MKRNKNKSKANAGFEPLENRRLMSAAVFDGSIMTLQGDANQSNEFNIREVSNHRTLGYADFTGTVAANASIQKIIIYTGNDTDTVSVGSGVPMTVEVIDPNGNINYVKSGQTDQFTPAPISTSNTNASGGSTSNSGSNGGGASTTTNGSGSSSNGSSNNSSNNSNSNGGSGSGASGSTNSGSSGGGSTTTFTPVNPNAPIPVITVTAGSTILPGESVHVQGINSTLKGGDVLHATYFWDFGDPGSTYDRMTGFNAAHAYDTPGTYTVTLAVTNEQGLTSVATTQVIVSPDNRQTIYVSTNGSDSNNGLSPNAPIQSIDEVNKLLANNTRVLFEDGQTFNTSSGINVNGFANVYIGSYGQGAQPVLMYNGPQTYGQLIAAQLGTTNLTIQGLTFDSIYTNELDDNAIASGIRLNGDNITIRDNTFLNVLDDIDLSGAPNDVLIQNNTSPSLTGLRAYFVWADGNEIVIQGNSVANSTRESVLRVGGCNDILIADNTLSNVSGASWGDTQDGVKGSIAIQAGNYAYVYGNIIPSGPVGVGPLSTTQSGSLNDPGAQFNYCVFQNNQIWDAVLIQPGANHIRATGNVIHQDGNAGFTVNATEGVFGRVVSDLYIDNNTVIDPTIWGDFLKVVDGTANGITVDNNLYVAPNYVIGSGQAIIYVSDTSLASFREIKNNVWPVPQQVYGWANGGYFYIAPQPGVQSGYVTPAEWEALGIPTGDVYENVNLPANTFSVNPNGFTAGSEIVLPLSFS